MPRNQPGPERNDDRQVISGIPHVITAGCRWCDCPDAYGPPTTIYNRFNRWSRRGFWRAILAALAKAGWAGYTAALDSTYVWSHRSAHGAKGGSRARDRPVVRRPDHEDPRAHRRARPPRRPSADVGQRQRRDVCARRAGRGARPHPPPWLPIKATTPAGCAPTCGRRASRPSSRASAAASTVSATTSSSATTPQPSRSPPSSPSGADRVSTLAGHEPRYRRVQRDRPRLGLRQRVHFRPRT